MKINQKFLALIAVIMSLSLLTAPISASNPAIKREMAAAQYDLEKVLKHLKLAAADKDGFRDKAIAATTAALSSVKNNIAFSTRGKIRAFIGNTDDFNEKFPATESSASETSALKQAKTSLTSALKNIQSTAPDSRGYHAKALTSVNEAIMWIDKALNYKKPKS